MAARTELSIVRWSDGEPSRTEGLRALLTAYHLRTEAEKGHPVGVDRLPDRYRAEITTPRAAFEGATVLMALDGEAPAGCVVVARSSEGVCEIKRLWTEPHRRGRGVASALLDASLARAVELGADAVELSVWSWRTGAIALYERLGFSVVDSWDDRAELVCMRRGL